MNLPPEPTLEELRAWARTDASIFEATLEKIGAGNPDPALREREFYPDGTDEPLEVQLVRMRALDKHLARVPEEKPVSPPPPQDTGGRYVDGPPAFGTALIGAGAGAVFVIAFVGYLIAAFFGYAR